MSPDTPFLDHKWEGVVKILELEFLMRIKVESHQKARSNLSRWYQDRTNWPIRSSGRDSRTCSRWTGNRDYPLYESPRTNRFINAKRTLFWFVHAYTRWQTLHWQWNSSQMQNLSQNVPLKTWISHACPIAHSKLRALWHAIYHMEEISKSHSILHTKKWNSENSKTTRQGEKRTTSIQMPTLWQKLFNLRSFVQSPGTTM